MGFHGQLVEPKSRRYENRHSANRNPVPLRIEGEKRNYERQTKNDPNAARLQVSLCFVPNGPSERFRELYRDWAPHSQRSDFVIEVHKYIFILWASQKCYS